jgi:lipopolysaccharide export system permease protein
MNRKFHIGTLDRYVIRKFIGTFFFIMIIIITIIIIFDISEKVDNFVEKEAPLKAVIFNYYATMIPYYINLFSPLLVFISVIFFTSKMASSSEIVAVLAGGISFNRLLRPYFISAFFIASISLLLNLFLIPPANIIRLDFTEKYIKDKYYNTGTNFHFQVSPDTYVYLESFSSPSNMANKLTIETIEGHTIKSKLSAASARWDTLKNTWVLYDYFIRYNDGIKERVERGATMDTLLPISVADFNKRESVVESYNYHELNQFIKTQKMRGDRRVIYALIEKHTRFAMPFSAFILTVMGVALSSKKKRGGIGLNLGIGIALSFTYILFLRFSQMFVHGGIMPPWLALWVPNMLFAVVSYILYRIAPK